MNEHDDPVDDAVRRMAKNIEPSEAERRKAEEKLRAAIEAEQVRQSPDKPLGSWPWVAAAAAVLVGLFLGVQLLRPSPTGAAIEEIAETVQTMDPTGVPKQDFLYTEAVITSVVEIPADMLSDVDYEGEALAYLLPTRRQTWYGNDNTVQLRTTNQVPVFFSEQAENAYYAADLDAQDMIRKASTDTFTDDRNFDQWPIEPNALDKAISERIPPDSGQSEDAQYLEIALGLIREVFTPPSLRASTLIVIGQIPSLELINASGEQSTFAIDYEQGDIAVRQTFTLTSRGELVSEEVRLHEKDRRLGIPADTAIFTAEYSTPVVVDTLDQP